MTSIVFDNDETNDIPNIEEYNLQPQIHVNQRVRVTSNFGPLSEYKEPKNGTVIKIMDSNNIAPGVSIVYEIQMDEKLPGEEERAIFALGPDAFKIIECVPYTEPSIRPPRKDDKIIVIQSPMRFKYATGRLNSSEKTNGSFEVKIFGSKSEGRGDVITSLFAPQFIVITSWFPKVGEYVVAPKIQGGTIAKVTKTDRDMNGSIVTILPKYDIPRSRSSLFGKNNNYNKKKLRGHWYTIDKKVEIANATIRRGILEDNWDIVEDNNLVNNMLQRANELKKKPAEKSTRSPDCSVMEDVVKHYQEERERLSEKFKRERNDFKDKIKELNHHLEMGDRARYTQLKENEKLEHRLEIGGRNMLFLQAKIKSAEANEQDLDTFHCAICFEWICPISKHLFNTDELEDEFTEAQLNETVEDSVLECDNCHKRFHKTCLNNWLNTANSHGRCPFCREIINAVVPVKQLKMTWFANRLRLKF